MSETISEFGEIATTLDTCTSRLAEMRQELELIATLVRMTSVSLRRMAGTTPAETDLRQRLERHRDRLTGAIGAAVAAADADFAAEDVATAPARRGGAVNGPAAATEGHFPFRMDPVGRTIRIGRRRVPLTESEYHVVERLWEEMPAPVSRQSLLDHLYAGREAPGDAVLDMFIFRIRQKLKNAGCTDAAIRSVRGVGWALEFAAPDDLSGEMRSGLATDPA